MKVHVCGCAECFCTYDNDNDSAEIKPSELTENILCEVGKLAVDWNNLLQRSDHWKHRIDEFMTASVL